MNGFVIRDADPADKEQIGLMWLYLMQYHRDRDSRFQISLDSSEQYERYAVDLMRSKNGRVIVAQDVASSEIVAYAMGEIQSRPTISVPGPYGFVSDLFVMEEWRHGGLGKTLFNELKHWFIERKALAIELYVSEANPHAHAFWREMGLEPFLQLMHVDL